MLRTRLLYPLLRLRPKAALRAAFISALMIALFQLQPQTNALQQVQTRGTLVLTGISGPTTFTLGADGGRGLQFELARQFAAELGVRLDIHDAGDAASVLTDIHRNNADIAITGLATDDPRLKRLRTAKPYMAVSELLIQRMGTAAPSSFDALDAARIGVMTGSSEALRLKALTRWRPDLQVIEFDDKDPLALLEQLDARELDYIALNSSEYEARRTLFPATSVALTLQDSSELAWAFVKTRDQSLFQAAQDFMARKQADGTLDKLVAFYSQGNSFEAHTRNFQRDMARRLPHYQPLFEQSAKRHGIEWRLLAAIGYQESKWQPDAISPTGVQGLMMLTRDTAAHMGVADRTDPRQSIAGGARYFQQILKSLPDTVREPDRTWMALAAYNMGPAYVERARRRALAAGDDADRWLSVSDHLRQMGIEARRQGRSIPVGQALLYVQHVRHFHDALLMASAQESDGRMAAVNRRQRLVH
ncbi:MAG: membrane-bound lytic murein transglycosylase MltF [Moraxellaceae bacterium]|nr:membrane-bound lytic murein transglycosylase MltF [Moraxellaceae bacterium]